MGVQVQLGRWKVGPVVRYTHWAPDDNSAGSRTKRNQIELLVRLPRAFFSSVVVQKGIVRVFDAVSRTVLCALLTVLAISGAVIALRALFGPLTFPVKVTSPVNPEGWFGLALVLTMLVSPNPV